MKRTPQERNKIMFDMGRATARAGAAEAQALVFLAGLLTYLGNARAEILATSAVPATLDAAIDASYEWGAELARKVLGE